MGGRGDRSEKEKAKQNTEQQMRETKTLARWCNLLSINSHPNKGVAFPSHDTCHNTNARRQVEGGGVKGNGEHVEWKEEGWEIRTPAPRGTLPLRLALDLFGKSPVSRAQAHRSLPKEGRGPVHCSTSPLSEVLDPGGDRPGD